MTFWPFSLVTCALLLSDNTALYFHIFSKGKNLLENRIKHLYIRGAKEAIKASGPAIEWWWLAAMLEPLEIISTKSSTSISFIDFPISLKATLSKPKQKMFPTKQNRPPLDLLLQRDCLFPAKQNSKMKYISNIFICFIHFTSDLFDVINVFWGKNSKKTENIIEWIDEIITIENNKHNHRD